MKITIKETAIFGMLGALMFALKKLMEFLPNIHLNGVLIVAITVVYRKKALFPIFVYVLLDGILGGFSAWWVPYLYIWTLLWGAVMLLPKNMPPKIAPIVYTIVCALHGLLFGILYAPAQAIMFSLNFSQTIGWIASGFYFDLLHAAGNLVCGAILIMPIVKILKLADKNL